MAAQQAHRATETVEAVEAMEAMEAVEAVVAVEAPVQEAAPATSWRRECETPMHSRQALVSTWCCHRHS
jgi:predicted nuclease with RNAse H fold